MKLPPTPNNMYGDHSGQGDTSLVTRTVSVCSVTATAAPRCWFVCIVMAGREMRWAGHVARMGRRAMGTEF